MNELCACPAPGFCERHQVEKTEREFELCAGFNCTPQQCERYFRAWEECRMPGQHCAGTKEAEADQVRGWGDRISRAIQWVSGGRVQPCGGCKKREAWLNHYFPHDTPPVERVIFREPVRRNLLYHVMPIAGNGIWQRNLDELLKRIDLFNGRRVVGIVTDSACDPPEAVQSYLAGAVDEFIVEKNSPRLREVVTFVPLLERVESSDPGEVTFYAHAKGVTKPVDPGVTVHRWADAMYAACLDDWPRVCAALSRHAMAGSFKRYGQFTTRNNNRWHYSGTYYWFRNRDVFQRNWRFVDQRFFGTESWPGHMFKAEETACLFLDDAEDLYKMDYWNQVVQPQLDGMIGTQTESVQ